MIINKHTGKPYVITAGTKVLEARLNEIEAKKGKHHAQFVYSVLALDEMILVSAAAIKALELAGQHGMAKLLEAALSNNTAQLMGWGHQLHNEATKTTIDFDEVTNDARLVEIEVYEAVAKDNGVDPHDLVGYDRLHVQFKSDEHTPRKETLH